MFQLVKIILVILKSLYSVIYLNFFFKKNLKVILFYHPEKKLTNITRIYMDQFLKLQFKNYKVIFAHQDINEIDEKNFIFIQHNFLKFIFKIDIFISSYVSDYFTYRSKKIYIHHDIYDTPIADNKKIYQLKNKLNKYDYIFVPTLDSYNFFRKLLISKVKIREIGYIKLDILRNLKRKKIIQKQKNIIIAPTNIYSFKDFSIKKQIGDIISYLLQKTNNKVILRPHPSNRDDLFYLKIVNKFKENKNFKYDLSNNYLKVYLESKILITDISGTAYTYAFLTNNPVIFFFKSKKILKKNKFNNLNYFKDINKVGKLAFSMNDFKTKLIFILKNKNVYKKKISILRMNKIKFLDKSKIRFENVMKDI